VNISAIDPSMSSTGMANVKSGDLGEGTVKWGTARIKSSPTGDTHTELRARFRAITAQISNQLVAWGPPNLIVMEGPSLHSVGRQHTMAGLWWMVFEMIDDAAPVLIVPPPNRIQYATGKGNSSKDVVMLAASRRYSDAPITNNDDADAVVLAAMGARVIGDCIDTSLPQICAKAVAKLSIQGSGALV
jgi:crossover junction endodeoxyribonuclease RuvC